MRLLFLPMGLAMAFSRKPAHYYRTSALAMVVTLFAACVWLATPFAMWQSFGMPYVFAWLVPTAIVVFGMGALNHLPGGG